MNNPDSMPIDVEEERLWLTSFREERSLTWPQLSRMSGIPAGTLSTFGGGTYHGRNDNVAKQVFKFRQTLAAETERAAGLAAAPGYFETKTSNRLHALMTIARLGRITVAAMGPGTGKTIAAEEYQAITSNCWMATIMHSTRASRSMLKTILRAVGAPRSNGSAAQLTEDLCDTLALKQGAVLIVDEANHLQLEELEVLRGIHDRTGVGLCLLGNEELLMRIRGGAKRDQYGRLNSRIAESHVQHLPEPEDVDAFCDAWDVKAAGMRTFMMKIARSPGSGGLRECRQIVERASMFAADENRAFSFADLKEAQSTRASSWVKTGEAA